MSQSSKAAASATPFDADRKDKQPYTETDGPGFSFVAPIVRKCLARKGIHGDELEELCRESVVRLLYAARRTDSDSREIENPQAYARIVAERVFADHMRRERPNWCRLKRRVLYVLDSSPHALFALWRYEGALTGGLSNWRGRRPGNDFLVETLPRDLIRSVLGDSDRRDPGELSLPELLARILHTAGGPLEVDQLTNIAAAMLGITEPRHESLDGSSLSIRDHPIEEDHAQRILSCLQGEDLSVELWNQIQSLPIRQRTALLLGMDSDQLLLVGSTVTAICNSLEVPFDEIYSLWSSLPLPDREIGRRLDATPIQVSNLRKCARERLQRWLKAQEIDPK